MADAEAEVDQEQVSSALAAPAASQDLSVTPHSSISTVSPPQLSPAPQFAPAPISPPSPLSTSGGCGN